MPGPKKIFRAAKRRGQCFWPSRGSGGMLPWKSFKIKGLRLAKNAFPEISAWKNKIKSVGYIIDITTRSQHVACS